MRVIICAGDPYSGLDAFGEILKAVGVGGAAPSERNPMDIHDWHRHLLQTMEADPYRCAGELALSPGRAWEDMAIGIFQANLEGGDWGWADFRSTWLLDFWRVFDPQVRFILSFTKPARYLAASSLQMAAGELTLDQAVEAWVSYADALLRFHLRHRDTSVLVSDEGALREPERLVDIVASRFGVKLAEENAAIEWRPQNPISPLAEFLAERMLQQFPQADARFQELQSVAAISAPATATESVDPWSDFCALELLTRTLRRDSEEQQAEVATLQERLVEADTQRYAQERAASELQHEKEIAIERIARLEQDAAEQARSSDEKVLAVERELEDTSAQLKDAVSERELLLVQLRQVQNELGVTLKANADVVTELDQVRSALSRVEQDLAAAQRSVDQGRTDLAARQMTEESLQAKVADLSKKLALQEAQAAKLAEECHGQVKRMAEKRQKVDVLAATQSELQVQLEKLDQEKLQLSQVKSDLDNRLTAALAEVQALASALAKAKEEQAKALAERQQQVDALARSHGELKAQMETQRQEMAGLRQTKEALENRLAEAATAREQLQATLHGGEAQVTQERKLNGDLTAQLASLREDSETAASRHKNELDALHVQLQQRAQEGDLLLVQLHQVQEELELYFLRADEATRRAAEGTAAVRRMVARWPNYVEAEPPRDTSWVDGAEGQAFRYELTNVKQAARLLPSLRVVVTIHPETDVEVHLAEGQGSLRLNEVAAAKSLSTSDWLLVSGVTDLAISGIDEGTLIAELPNSAEGPLDWCSVANRLKDLRESLAAKVRCDAVALTEAYVAANYEHLSLRCENLCYGRRVWPLYDFKLMAKDVATIGFSSRPTLAFRPLPDGSKPFATWPPSATADSFGEKVEVEFSSPVSWASGDWRGLSDFDRRLVLGLVDAMPGSIADLEAQGAALQRPWDDWRDLVSAMQSRIQPTGPTIGSGRDPEVGFAAANHRDDTLASVAITTDTYGSAATEASNAPDAALSFEEVELFKQIRSERYGHIAIRLHSVVWGANQWESLEFKIAARQIGNTLGTAVAGLEFRPGELLGHVFETDDLPTADDFGQFLLVQVVDDPIQLDAQLALLSPRDRQLVESCARALPAVIDALEEQAASATDPWSEWRQLADQLCRQVGLGQFPTPVAEPNSHAAI